jgi:hypothetical protein
MTAAVTCGHFSSRPAMLPLKESSLLERLRTGGPCAGVSLYLGIVRRPILRWCSILRMGPALGPVKPVQVADLFGVRHRLVS